MSTADALEVIGQGESPLRVPSGYKVVTLAPSEESLNADVAASDALIGKVIFVRFEDYGWCRGEILRKNFNKSKKFKSADGEWHRINFITQFDIDENSSDLALESKNYDPSADAEDGAWLLLEVDE